jgi:hypothetical protein
MVAVTEAASPAGATVIAFSHGNSASTPNSVTDAASNVYTQIGAATPANNIRSRMFACVAASALALGDTMSFGYSATTGIKLALAASCTGVLAHDQSVSAVADAATAMTATTAALASANSIIFAGIDVDNGNLDSEPALDGGGWTQVAKRVQGAGAAYLYAKTVSTAGAVTLNVTLPVARTATLILSVFRGG